jgi:hypothetical protein
MEKFSGILKTTYHFTDTLLEIPDFLKKEIDKVLTIDFTTEKFIASCWVDNIFAKGKIFVLITNQRVIYKDPARLNQNAFTDITGVEKDISKNISVLSAGNATELFPSIALPTDKLLILLFKIIDSTWRTAKNSSNLTQASSDNSFNKMQKLKQMLDSELITKEEYELKKVEILKEM